MLALVLDGLDRKTAAEACGMERQTLRDWAHRYNAAGLAGLRNLKPPGHGSKLTARQQAELTALVGPDPAVHGVVRWRRVDLRDELERRFGVALQRLVHRHRPVLSQIKSAAELLWFRKPLRAPNSESNLMITQTAPGIAKHIILLVDDDEAVRDSVRNIMESEGFEVRTFSNGHDLLNEANLPAVGCMVVDYNMPSLNGLELVGVLRGRGVSMPAILITGNPTKHVRDRAAAIAVLVVEKPQLGKYLVDCVRKAVANHAQLLS